MATAERIPSVMSMVAITLVDLFERVCTLTQLFVLGATFTSMVTNAAHYIIGFSILDCIGISMTLKVVNLMIMAVN